MTPSKSPKNSYLYTVPAHHSQGPKLSRVMVRVRFKVWARDRIIVWVRVIRLELRV